MAETIGQIMAGVFASIVGVCLVYTLIEFAVKAIFGKLKKQLYKTNIMTKAKIHKVLIFVIMGLAVAAVLYFLVF